MQPSGWTDSSRTARKPCLCLWQLSALRPPPRVSLFAVTLTGITGRDCFCLGPALAQASSSLLAGHRDSSQEPFPFGAPMSYPQALVQTPWHSRSPAPVTSFEAGSLRSLKVSLLSATAQLRLSDEARRRQSHHKQQSVDLYGRDDAIDALWLQQQIALACSEGWRPSRPISRGGQAPTLEASFQVPRSQPPMRFVCLAGGQVHIAQGAPAWRSWTRTWCRSLPSRLASPLLP